MVNDTIRNKTIFFKDKLRAVHITTFQNRFYNGIILEVKSDFIIFEDEKIGETLLFFAEIKNIEAREPKENKNEM